MFRSIIDHRQVQVVLAKSKQKTLSSLHCRLFFALKKIS